jgi:hypothetical protein
MSNNPNELIGEVLFGKVRRNVLSTFVLNPDRSFYLLELIRLLDCGRGAVQREVSKLSGAGILIRKKVGNQVHYRANTDSLIFSELRSIFSKTTGLVDFLRNCIESCRDPIGMAFIYGDYALGKAEEDTPVNLMIIGDTTMDALRSCTCDFAMEAARELHITVVDPYDFKRRVASADRRIRDILSSSRIFLSGGERELTVLSTTGDDLFAGLF